MFCWSSLYRRYVISSTMPITHMPIITQHYAIWWSPSPVYKTKWKTNKWIRSNQKWTHVPISDLKNNLYILASLLAINLCSIAWLLAKILAMVPTNLSVLGLIFDRDSNTQFIIVTLTSDHLPNTARHDFFASIFDIGIRWFIILRSIKI